MKLHNSYTFIALAIIISGCASLYDAPKERLTESTYNISGAIKCKAFVKLSADTITIIPLTKNGELDSSRKPIVLLSEQASPSGKYNFKVPSFDLDVITIPFKYRAAIAAFPNQLSTSLNGNIYCGYRWDRYSVGYKKNVFGTGKRHITHIGYSAGAFGGIGQTPINPWVTQNSVNKEYDGMVVLTGVGAIAGVNSFTLGVALGVDRLLDENSVHWIYRGKPWIGLIVGVNLN